jgi:nucleoside-diphosphate-sugar epimerase
MKRRPKWPTKCLQITLTRLLCRVCSAASRTQLSHCGSTDVASKTRAEQAVWQFVKDSTVSAPCSCARRLTSMQPAFAVNAVLPDLVFGPVVNPAPGSYSSGTWLTDLFHGKVEGNPLASFMNPAAWVVDVRDVAALHVAAALASDVNSERVWASSEPGRLNELLQALRDAYLAARSCPISNGRSSPRSPKTCLAPPSCCGATQAARGSRPSSPSWTRCDLRCECRPVQSSKAEVYGQRHSVAFH